MPHQCLKCGQSFAEGSSEILKGCSDCGGTRFFYTETPLDAQEREKLMARTKRDLRTMVEDAARAAPQDRGRKTGGGDWVALGPGYLRRLVSEVVSERPSQGGPTVREYVDAMQPHTPRPTRQPDAAPRRDIGIDFVDEDRPQPTQAQSAPPAAKPRKATPPPPPRPPQRPARAPETPPRTVADEPDAPPEVLRVVGEGAYEIDLKGLLEDHPIIVNKDGSYLIHLPSVFDGVQKAKRWKK